MSEVELYKGMVNKMKDNEIKEMLELHIKNDIDLLPKNQKTVLDYITNLQQENERINRQLKYYMKYRSDTILQKEVYDILESGKDLKNLHKHKNTGGLLWIDLPMTLFSSLTSYIRTRDVMLDDYKSRREKAVEILKRYTDNESNYYVPVCEVINILNGDNNE